MTMPDVIQSLPGIFPLIVIVGVVVMILRG